MKRQFIFLSIVLATLTTYAFAGKTESNLEIEQPEVRMRDEPKWGQAVDGVKIRVGGAESLGLFYSNNTLWFDVENTSDQTIEFNATPYGQKDSHDGWGYLEIHDAKGQPVNYAWKEKENIYELDPGKRQKIMSFVNGRPLRVSGPGQYKARLTLTITSVDPKESFLVKSNWHSFTVTPCGYPSQFVPATAYEQLQLANACNSMLGYGHTDTQEVVKRYQAIIKEHPNSKYELESHFGIAQTDNALAGKHCREIIDKWPKVVTSSTIHARNRVQPRNDWYQWLKSVTDKQISDSARDYFVWPFEPSDEGIQRAIKSMQNAIKLYIQTIEEDPTFNPANKTEVEESAGLISMVILPRTPMRSMKEYHHTYWSEISSKEEREKTTYELRIISTNSKSLTVIPNIRSNSKYGGVQLTESQQRKANTLSDGGYLVAVYANGVRCSNVARLTIDPDFDVSAEPVLTLVPLPLGPGQKLPLLGIRAVGPTPQDPKLKNNSIAFPRLIVDGIERNLTTMAWVGPVAPLESGKVDTRILNLDGYEPAIEPGKEHTVKAIVGKYESSPVIIPADDTLTRQWNNAMMKLSPILSPKAELQGKVTGSDGNAGSDYEVHLLGSDGEHYSELSDNNGRYTFVNVPAGEYKVVCNPKGKGQPGLTVEQVIVDANEPMTLDLSLERKHNFTGKISYEDGGPADRMDVALSCEDTQNNTEFTDFTTTDTNGEYKLGGPFKNVTYIGINGRRVIGQMPKLKAGLTELNYVLKKNDRGKYTAFPSNEANILPEDMKWTSLPEGWGRAVLWEKLAVYLKEQAGKDLPGCKVTMSDLSTGGDKPIKDGQLHISYRTQKYTVERSTSKTGREKETRIETGPQPDGLIMRIWLSDQVGQAVIPQTLDKTYWKVDLKGIYLPELKIYLFANVGYGDVTDDDLLHKYINLAGWLESIFADNSPEVRTSN